MAVDAEVTVGLGLGHIYAPMYLFTTLAVQRIRAGNEGDPGGKGLRGRWLMPRKSGAVLAHDLLTVEPVLQHVDALLEDGVAVVRPGTEPELLILIHPDIAFVRYPALSQEDLQGRLPAVDYDIPNPAYAHQAPRLISRL